jgi:fibrillarin-like pre-rRNA processing protein
VKPTRLSGVFEDRDFFWTKNKVPGVKVYGEKLRLAGGSEYRNWNPFRSKMCALAKRAPDTPWINPDEDVLYLGASSGTSVSHISDLLHATLYAVEFSPRSVRDLLWNMEPRTNVVPILDDAGKPERYAPYIDRHVGALVQDVAQRHQVDIFLRNIPFLKPGGHGFLFVKARSMDVARPLHEIYDDVAKQLTDAGLKIVKAIDLEPFERDHRAFVVRK